MIIHGDCYEYMKTMKRNTIDSIITDPPYLIGFMNKNWDKTNVSIDVNMWRECFEVLKPGGFLLSFSSTRNYHRIVCAIEDAGFEIKDCIQWLYGSGLPKGLDIQKAIDKLGKDGEQWEGWKTQLKPACELVCVAQKPISEKNIAENILKWGVGAFNIDACRIPHNEPQKITKRKARVDDAVFSKNSCGFKSENTTLASANEKGRFPTNVIIDEEVADGIDKQVGKITKSTGGRTDNFFRDNNEIYGKGKSDIKHKDPGYGDEGGVSRYFYCPKASKSERNINCEDLPKGNTHVSVKPLKLMEYLVKLVTPQGGMVLDPFMGSGTTCIAAKNVGCQYIGIEKEQEYFDIAERRIDDGFRKKVEE